MTEEQQTLGFEGAGPTESTLAGSLVVGDVFTRPDHQITTRYEVTHLYRRQGSRVLGDVRVLPDGGIHRLDLEDTDRVQVER